jgi:hypothetical protein
VLRAAARTWNTDDPLRCSSSKLPDVDAELPYMRLPVNPASEACAARTDSDAIADDEDVIVSLLPVTCGTTLNQDNTDTESGQGAREHRTSTFPLAVMVSVTERVPVREDVPVMAAPPAEMVSPRCAVVTPELALTCTRVTRHCSQYSGCHRAAPCTYRQRVAYSAVTNKQ